MSPEDPGPRPDDGVPDAWTVSLDDVGPPAARDLDVMSGARPTARRRRTALAVLAAVVVLFGLAWLPGPGRSEDRTRPDVVGLRLAAPVSLTLPPGAVTLADRSYVGLRLYDGPGGVLVTVPSQVVEPSGIRADLPDNPVLWLLNHPGLFVTRVRAVRVAGRTATQVDYQLSREGLGDRRFYAVPLFCGWRRDLEPAGLGGLAACTQVSLGARVRATFVPVEGRTVLIEAVWPDSASPNGRMPRDLGVRYRALLAGMTAKA
jgi:hypothetical protein